MQNQQRLINKMRSVTISPLSDARLNDLTKALGSHLNFSELMDADYEEIMQRQQICQWLLSDDSTAHHNFFNFYRSEYTIPTEADLFIRYHRDAHERDTGFWNRTEAFCNLVQGNASLPLRINSLLNIIKQEGEQVYRDELALADEMLTEMRQVIAIKGILHFKGGMHNGRVFHQDIENKEVKKYRPLINEKHVQDISCYGTRVYHESLDHKEYAGLHVISSCFKKIGLHTFSSAIQRGIEAHHNLKALKPAQIRRTPRAIAGDVKNYLNQLFTPDNGFDNDADFTLNVAYQFNQDGLQVSLLDWKIGTASIKKNELGHTLEFGRGKIEKYVEKHDRKITRMAWSRSYKQANASMNDFFVRHGSFALIDSPNTYQVFCAPHFKGIYEKFKERIEVINGWKQQIIELYDQLQLLHSVTSAIRSSGLLYCFPTIPEEPGILEVDGCYPVRVRGTAEKEIHPFQNISVNGQIVNFTGRNGSGKSTVMLAVLDILCMAQCGLPVFARSARISPRTHILLSFLDRSSDQSTFKAKTEKDMSIVRIIKEIPTYQRKNTFVIVDELGSATDQLDVMRVARPFVSWLSNQGVSVMMSTQISELSEYVGGSCNGLNLIIRPNYDIEPGIGTGEPYEVAKEMGFLDMLGI